MGRPTKLTDKVKNEICRLIAMGMKAEDAAICSGVSRPAYFAWKKKGKEAKSGIYKEFADSLELAQSQCKMVHLRNLERISMGTGEYSEVKITEKGDGTVEKTITTKSLLPDANTSKWILGRRFPDEWGRQREETPQQTSNEIEVKNLLMVVGKLQELDKNGNNENTDRFSEIIQGQIPQESGEVE